MFFPFTLCPHFIPQHFLSVCANALFSATAQIILMSSRSCFISCRHKDQIIRIILTSERPMQVVAPRPCFLMCFLIRSGQRHSVRNCVCPTGKIILLQYCVVCIAPFTSSPLPSAAVIFSRSQTTGLIHCQ